MFLSTEAISSGSFQLDLPSLHNVNSKFALRLFFHGSKNQEQVVVEPLSSSYDTFMTFLINNHHGFAVPHNDSELGRYMFVGIPGPRLDDFNKSLKEEIGFRINGKEYISECRGTLYNYFAQYPGSAQTAAEVTEREKAFVDLFSERFLVKDYDKIPRAADFMFNLEIRVGNNSCGLLALSQNRINVAGASIGLPFGKISQCPCHLVL